MSVNPVPETEISRLTENIWLNVLGLVAEPDPVETPDETGQGFVAGTVAIQGAWNGCVEVACRAELARYVAAIMFEVDPEDLSPDDVADALGEVTNIMTGHLKSALPGPSDLSTPVVHQIADAPTPDPFTSVHVAFRCQGIPFHVTVREAGSDDLAGAERRVFTRVGPLMKVIVTAEGRTQTCSMRDVSLRGIYLQTATPLPMGTQCTLRVNLDDSEDGTRIDADAKVVRCDPDGMAVEVNAIEVESFYHLRNLVRYNAMDPNQVENECSAHLGINPYG